MTDISVVVPVYYGKKYIPSLIQMLEKCTLRFEGKKSIELILSNDAPKEELGEYDSIILDKITVLNTKVNRGIHGARVEGLKVCRGKYILFLDQDDQIFENYFSSQLGCIDGHDVSVCNAICQIGLKGDALHSKLEESKSMLDGNYLVSPGQVLIRRDAIPQLWMDRQVTFNGADDWLLWLIMQCSGVSFTFNEEYLYKHMIHSENTSSNYAEMYRSKKQVCEIIQESRLLSREELCRLDITMEKGTENILNKLEQGQQYLYYVEKWEKIENKKRGIGNFLREKSINKIAIYGYGYMGRLVLDRLQSEGIEVLYLIDKAAEYLTTEIPVYTIKDEFKEVDAVLITLLQNEENVVNNLRKKMNTPVWTLKEIINLQENRM